jgi:hypothetical protein
MIASRRRENVRWKTQVSSRQVLVEAADRKLAMRAAVLTGRGGR